MLKKKNSNSILYVLAFFCVFILWACNNSKETNDESDEEVEIEKKAIETDTEVEGFDPENLYVFDLDADSIPDSFFVVAPSINESVGEYSQDCNGPCVTKITFGDKLPPIFAQQSIGGELVVLEDINENGFRELAFFPYWFQSCWSRMDIFSYDGSEWKLVKAIDYNSCEESLPTSFEKIDKGILRVITNGEQMEESLDENGEVIKDFIGVEAKIYDVEIN